MKLLTVAIVSMASVNALGQKGDTLAIGPRNLGLNNVRLVIQPTSFYLKKKADSPAEKITLVRINVILPETFRLAIGGHGF